MCRIDGDNDGEVRQGARSIGERDEALSWNSEKGRLVSIY